MEGGYNINKTVEFKKVNGPVLTVITIVYNGADYIERTINSVINQKYLNIEYLIIDGGSKDETLSIVKKYESHIAYWVSEKDGGIYDAMNKGLEKASGDYVLYMNAGDQFFDNLVVDKIFSIAPNADIYYGDTLIVDENGNSLGPRRLRPPRKLTWRSFRMGMLVCHQSFVVKRSIAPKYNLSYKIAADIDWCINCMRNAKKFVNTGIVISKYLSGGTSWQNQKQALMERLHIMHKNYGAATVMSSHLLIALRYAKHRLMRGKVTN